MNNIRDVPDRETIWRITRRQRKITRIRRPPSEKLSREINTKFRKASDFHANRPLKDIRYLGYADCHLDARRFGGGACTPSPLLEKYIFQFLSVSQTVWYRRGFAQQAWGYFGILEECSSTARLESINQKRGER